MSRVLNHATTNVVVSNSAAETTLYTFTVPNNWLVIPNRAFRLKLYCTLLNNSGANRTYTLRWKQSATAVLVDSVVVPASASARAVLIEVDIVYDGASNAQVASLRMNITAPDGAASGVGGFTAGIASDMVIIDTTTTTFNSAGVAILLSIQSDAATATQTFTMMNALLEAIH